MMSSTENNSYWVKTNNTGSAAISVPSYQEEPTLTCKEMLKKRPETSATSQSQAMKINRYYQVGGERQAAVAANAAAKADQQMEKASVTSNSI